MDDKSKPAATPAGKRPDWILSTLQNKIPNTLEGLHEADLVTGQFSIRGREDYWNRDDIKQAFTDDEGVEQRTQFDAFFDEQESIYGGNLAAESWLNQNSDTFSNAYAEQLGNAATVPIVIDGIPDLNGRFYDSNRTEEGRFGQKKYGIRENAINNYVLTENGNKVSVDDYLGGIGGYNSTETLKFAKDESGRYLTGDNNRPYLIPVKHGERLKSYDELYSGFSDLTGRYGTGEGFGGAVGGVVSSIAKAPINVAASTIEGFNTTLNAFNAFLGLDESEFQKDLIDVTNRLNATKISASEKALDDWTSVEGITGVASEAAMQLIGLMSGGAALRAMGASARVSSQIPITAMGMMSAAPIYNLAREKGFTPREAASMYTVAVSGFTVLAKADDLLVKSIMGESGISSRMLGDVAEQALSLNVAGSLSKASLKSFGKSFPQFLKKASSGAKQALNNIPDTLAAKAAGSSVVEAAQETAEQIWDTSVRGMGNMYSELKYEGIEDRPAFRIVLDEEIESYKQAAVGGAIGGAMASPIMRYFYGTNTSSDDRMINFMKSIVNGEEQKIFDLIDRLKAEGRFGTPWADADGKLLGVEQLDSDIESSNRNATTKTDPVSENSIGAEIFTNHVKALVQVRDELGLKDFKIASKNQLSEAHLKAIANFSLASGFFKANDFKNVDPEDLYSRYSTMGRDAGSLAVEITKLDGDIREGRENDVSDEVLEDLTAKKDRLQKRLDNITQGKFTNDYVSEILYNFKSFSNDADAKDYQAITGKSFANLNNKIATDTSNRKSEINRKAEEQVEANDTATIESFEGISKTKKSGLISEAITEQTKAANAVYALGEISDEDRSTVSPEQVLEDPDLAKSPEAKTYKDITNKINALQKHVADDDIVPVTPNDERGIELSQYLNMTKADDRLEVLGIGDDHNQLNKSLATNLELDTSTGESILSKLDVQLEELKNSINKSGIPLYSNVEAPKDILLSIDNRKAQILANFNLNGFNGNPELTDAEFKELNTALDKMAIEAQNLYMIAQTNLSNPEVAINAAAIYKLSSISSRLETISDAFIKGTAEHGAVAELINNSRPALNEALENSDITIYLQHLNKLEDAIYGIYSAKDSNLQDALAQLKPNEFKNIDEYNNYKDVYDYFYGIVSLKSSDFYDLYHDALNSSLDEGLNPSVEQRLIIKEASQKLAISGYDVEMATSDTVPGFTDIINLEDGSQNILSDSIYIDGGGGTGKSAIVQPMVAAIASKLNGGKIFATSINKGNKVANIRKINNDFGGLELSDSASTIDEILQNSDKLKDIGVIVFDEATLLDNKAIGERNTLTSTDEELSVFGLKDIQLKVNAFNEGKTDNRLKIIYTGDSNQNTQNQDNERIFNGISDKTAQYVPRTDRLSFSFRSQNQDLKSIADYIRASHDAGKTPKTLLGLNNEIVPIKNDEDKIIGTERIGTTITNNDRNFEKATKAFVASLNPEQIKNTVYITDKDDVPDYIMNSGITVTNSIYAQGEEWDNTIINLRDPLFSNTTPNYGVKKSYYTAVTRAKKYILINLPTVETLSSKAGKVYQINPLLLDSTRDGELDIIQQILNRNAGEYEGTGGKKPIVQPKPKTDDGVHNIFQEEDDVPFRESLAGFLQRFADDAMQFHSFFTTQRIVNGETQRIEDVHNAKRKFLFSNVGASEHGYRLVIAKQGSAEYNNVVRPDKQFDGQYAIFLEGYDKSNLSDNPVKSTVIGILGDTTKNNTFKEELDKFIINSGVFSDTGTDTISIPMDRSLFTPGAVRGASGRKSKSKTVPKTLKELKANSEGIAFGTIRIFQDTIRNEDGSIKYRRGEAFVPASYRFGEKRLNEILDTYTGDLTKETRFTPLIINGKNLDQTQIFDMLQTELKTITLKNGENRDKLPDPNTKVHAYALSTNLGSMYASGFGRFTVSGRGDKDQRQVSSYWNKAYEALYARAVQIKDTVSGDEAKEHELYLKFLNRNRLTPDSDILNPDGGDVKNSYVSLEPGVEIPADVLANSSTHANNSKPYFFFQKYMDARSNSTRELRHFEKVLNDIRSIEVQVQRADPDNPKQETTETLKPFKNGFEFNIVASKGKTKSTFIKSAQEASPEAYDNNLVIRNIDFITQPSVNVGIEGIIDGLLANEIQTDPEVQQTNDTIEDGLLDEEGTQEIGGDNEEISNPDPISAATIAENFDTNDGTSLVDFQERYYPDSNVNHMMAGIDMFKRGIWNSLFNLSPVKGMRPTMTQDFGKSIAARRKALDKIREDTKGKGKILLNDDTNPELKAQYHASVGSAAFDFLMDAYFPTLKVDEDGNYLSPATTSNKSNIFNKEKATLLDDTANEMVKTMLFNTKELYIKNGQVYERDNYLSLGDVEDMIDIFSTQNEHNDLVQAMKDHIESNVETNPAILSLYYQFYSNTPYTTNNQQTYSLSAINNNLLAQDMVDGLSVFLSTAAAYKYVHVNLNGDDRTIKGVPSAGGLKPNILRNSLGQTLKTNASLIGGDVTYDTNTDQYSIKVIDGEIINVSARSLLSEENIIKVFQKLGVSGYTQDVLNELKKTFPASDTEIIERTTVLLHDILARVQASKTASDGEIISSFSKLLGGNFNTYVVKPMVKLNGVHDELSYRNSSGDIVNRLRNRIPINLVHNTITSIQNSPTSIYSNNMFVADHSVEDRHKGYQIVDWVAKDGIKYFKNGFTSSRPHKSFIASETMEYEIFWNFHETLRNTVDTDGTEARAVFSPMVYADGSTDVSPVILMSREQLENPDVVIQELFESRKASYNRIQNLIDAGQYNITSKSGKTLNTDEGFRENHKKYTQGTFEDFKLEIIDNLTALKTNIDENAPSIRSEIEKNPLPNLGMRTYDDTIKAFYFNWLAISSELGDITLGKIDNFKIGSSNSDKYVDFVKRSKMMISSRSGMIFRNNNWEERVIAEGMTPQLLREGMKLSRIGKVAYIKDITREFSSLDKSSIGTQEIWDGATFTNPITKIFQRASSGGRFGTKVPTVSKPVTNSIDPITGIGVGIKNAEFEITPKILRNGTKFVHQMMDAMLGSTKANLLTIVQGDIEGVTEENLYDNVDQGHFDILAIDIVNNQLQDELTHEIIPISSRKYGGGTVNDLNDDKPLVTEQLDFINKGQQLDASHDVTVHNDLAMLTQYLNAAAVNYKNPAALKATYAAVSKISIQAVEAWENLSSSDGGAAKRIMELTAESINKRLGVSYQHRLVNQKSEVNPNDVQFSLNDRQIVNTAISQLNSALGKEGVAVKLFGSQYVLHPQSSLIELVRASNGNVYLKSEVPAGLTIEATGVDLEWASPSRNGVVLEETEEYDTLVKEYDATNKSKAELHTFQNKLDALLSEEGWEAGVSEMLLPMSFGEQFFLNEEDLNQPINTYNAAFFTAKIRANVAEDKFSEEELQARGEAMVEDFTKMLDMLNVRIPTTGKHSAVVSKIVGFMQGSENSVFVSPKLLFIQGADQDIDKGNITSYKAVNGVIPMLDDDLKFDQRTKTLLKGNLGDNTYQIALRNKVTDGLMNISSDPKNAVEGNSAVDALLKDMQSLVKKRKTVYDKDSYNSYVKIRRDNQAGKVLVGIFANAQKAYETLYAYSKLTGQELGLNLDPNADLDRIAETFAALINASTDNAKEQILGSLGINESNANMVSFMVMKGMTIQEIDSFLQANEGTFKKIEKGLKYNEYTLTEKKIPAGQMREFFKGGKEIGLLGSSILNTDIPNSAYDSFKYKHKLNLHLSKVLGRPFDYNNFLTSEIYANDNIAALDNSIANGRASFNLLKVLNPFDNSHPSNTYSRVYKQADAVKNDNIKVIKHIDSLMSNYLSAHKKGKGVSEDNYNQGMDFMYGLAIHAYLNRANTDSIVGNYDLAKIKDRSEWIQHFNNVVIPQLKDKYATRANPNAFTEALRPIENKTLHKYPIATTYGVLDMRNLDDAQILTYDVSFNNPQLLDEGDKRALVLYSLITTGGKHGKGSYSQIFRHNELQGFNEFLDDFINDLDTQPMADLADVFDKFLRNDVEKGGALLANAIPYGYSNDIVSKDVQAEQELKVANETEADAVVNGNKTAIALTEQQLNSSSLLKKAVELHKKVNRPRGAVIPNIVQVISDGSAGVGITALEAAGEILEIPTGGKIRRGFKTEGNRSDESLGKRFGLSDDSTSVERDNVKSSKVTIVFGDITDADIATTLIHAKELNKPVFIQSRISEQGDTHNKITNLLGANNRADITLFTDATDLRNRLKEGNFDVLNITGTKKSKLSSKQKGIVFDTILKALTEDNAINYNSVSGRGGVAITMDENNNATYYPNTGESAEIENVYFAEIPETIQAQLENGEIELIPTVFDENGNAIQIDSSVDVIDRLNNDVSVILGIYRNGEFDNDNNSIKLQLNPDIQLSAIADYIHIPGQVFIDDVKWVNKGTQEEKSPPVAMSVTGYSSEGNGTVTYHGELTRDEANDIVADPDEYLDKSTYGRTDGKKHMFTIQMNQDSVVYDRLDASLPETYRYNRENNVSLKDEKKIIAYLKDVIIASDDSDVARRFLESFVVKQGSLYNKIRAAIFSHFDDFGDLVNQLSEETKEEITTLISQGRPIDYAEVRKNTLSSFLRDAGTTELRPTVLISIQKDVDSFTAENELKSYITTLYNFKDMHSGSKNAVFKMYNDKLKKLGGKKSNAGSKKKASSTKDNKRKDVNKNKLPEVKKYDKVGTNFNDFKDKLEFVEGLSGDLKQSFYESLINLSLNMNGAEFKRASKLLTKLGVDAGTASDILGQDVKLKGQDTVKNTPRPSAHIKRKNIPTFVSIMADQGHEVNASTISLYDTTKDGVSIIDVMHDISSNPNAEAFAKKFADKLIVQFEFIKNHYNNEEIADIRRICTI